MKSALLAICFSAALAGCVQAPTQAEIERIDYGPYPTEYEATISAYLRNILKDPESARIEYVFGPSQQWRKTGPIAGNRLTAGYLVCAFINAKNSYGAYVGRRLYWFMLHGGSVIEHEGSLGSAGADLAILRACQM